ncbi:hypothetical protein [Nocardioides taihuensis]|uniref:Secreted protein n=1 Tax=Nocardioides taihuensis TaxID=1835606 RepID=A0ABW0BL62_9ACTN
MPDREQLTGEDHPIAAGLIALVGVGLVVGLIAGLTVLGATRVLGLDGDAATAENTADGTLYIPKFHKTTAESGPLLTLAQEPTPTDGETVEPSEEETTKDKKPESKISLSASQTAVAPMEQIDLTGTYPGGEGAILRVERFTGGQWVDFAQITANVSNQTFSTYIQTGQTGVNKFRVVDTDTDLASNAVRVTVG